MNTWRRGSLTENPYVRTGFRITRVPREVSKHRNVVHLIGYTKNIVTTDASAHQIAGKPVSIAEIHAAEQILLDPKQRIAEELLEHATEKLPVDRIRRLLKEVIEAMAVEQPAHLPVKDLSVLRGLAAQIIDDYLAAMPGSSPLFGALELCLVPPFGKGED